MPKEFEEWFEDGAAFGFAEEELETLVPPPGAAKLVKEWLEGHGDPVPEWLLEKLKKG